jgi:hypothetical protein
MENLFFGFTLKDGVLGTAGWIFAEDEFKAQKMIKQNEGDEHWVFELPPYELDYLINERKKYDEKIY